MDSLGLRALDDPRVIGLAYACLVCVVGLLLAEQRHSARGRALFKPPAALLFLGVGLAAGASGSLSGQIILVGLGLSIVGDLCLIARAQRWFLAGLGAFLLAHVAYAVAFFQRGLSLWPALAALALALPLAALVVLDLWPDVPHPLRGPVAAYGAVITLMVVAAAGSVLGGHAPPVLLVGALAFYLSDVAVALERFREGGFGVRAMGLPLYFGGQLLLALGAAELTP